MTQAKEKEAKVISLFGKDEMNLVEFPFGPIRSTTAKTLEVEHQVFDKRLRREVTRRLIITGSDKWGLPRPIDDQVLVGLKTITHEAGYLSQKVEFSRYRLCRCLGWEPDGRAYARLEESLDRIKATTLKFKDSWYDKAEREYKSKTFSIIEDVEICSRDQLDRARFATGGAHQQLCSVRWSDVIWKSFQDGFIKTLDMRIVRRIAQGRRREVPLRLYRILDKRFWHAPIAKFDLRRLAIGTLGLCSSYSPSQMVRVLDRAARWLIECEYLDEIWYTGQGRNMQVHFRRRIAKAPRLPMQRSRGGAASQNPFSADGVQEDGLKTWLASQSEERLLECEAEAIASRFGSELERRIVAESRANNFPILASGPIRQQYVRRFSATTLADERKRVVHQ